MNNPLRPSKSRWRSAEPPVESRPDSVYLPTWWTFFQTMFGHKRRQYRCILSPLVQRLAWPLCCTAVRSLSLLCKFYLQKQKRKVKKNSKKENEKEKKEKQTNKQKRTQKKLESEKGCKIKIYKLNKNSSNREKKAFK